MKRVLIALLGLWLCLAASSCAAEDYDAAIRSALADRGISVHEALQQWGDTAACFASVDQVKHLIVLEKHDEKWQVVIDNTKALFQHEAFPGLLLDTDSAIFWTYTLEGGATIQFHSLRDTEGVWGPVDEVMTDPGFGDNTYVRATFWDEAHGGEIIRSYTEDDAQGNPLSYGTTLEYLPAPWLSGCIRLADFDVSRFPSFDYGEGTTFVSDTFLREAAENLLPDTVYIKGLLKDGALHFLVQRADGAKVYVICEYASTRSVHFIESTPLPEDTFLGVENFTDSLWVDQRCVTIQLLQKDQAGLQYIYDDAAFASGEGMLFFGTQAVWNEGDDHGIILYGEHPWDDVTVIDWQTLPHNLQEASAQMHAGGYAVVNNPNPADRLHLRERAHRKSASMGKYYNGTPVQVLSEEGDWAQVQIGDRRGYMMKQYLIYGPSHEALRLDTSAMPQLFPRGEALKVYDEPLIGRYTLLWSPDPSMKIIGIIGDAWYHVWFPSTGTYGFICQGDVWVGNG